MPRVFAGIATSIDLTRELKTYRRAFENERWTYKTDYHLTLAFIGNVEDAVVDQAREALIQVALRNFQFDFVADEFGSFPEPNDAIVFWAGSCKKCKPLLDLASDLRTEFSVRNVPFDQKPFMPHITLSRFRRGMDVRDRMKKFNRQIISVSNLVLFSTRPSDVVPRYSRLVEFPLKPPESEYTY